MLLFFGVESILNQEPTTPAENDPASGVYKARKAGERPFILNPDQYENPDYPGAYMKWTGRKSGTRPTAICVSFVRCSAPLER